MLALHGIDAYGLEVSKKAVEACNIYAQSQLSDPNLFNFGSSADKDVHSRGTVKFVVGDFFKQDWEVNCGGGAFDLIYDYTVSTFRFKLTCLLTKGRSFSVPYFLR